MLIKDYDCIASMNQAAGRRFGDLRGEKAVEDLGKLATSAALLRLVNQAVANNQIGTTLLVTVGEDQFEFTLAPFSQEENNRLHWLFLRDITELSRQQADQARTQSQTEALLAEKTRQLEESEKAREKHATEAKSLKEKLQNPADDGRLIGSSPALHSLLKQIGEVAANTTPVLICGEPGTGKGRVAQMIRTASARHHRPCLDIDCRTAALDEAALLGHVEQIAPGIFALVDSGTLYLDEVEALPLPLQNTLLKTLREGEIIPVGGKHPRKVAFRVIATTSADIPSLVQNGAFRLELYHRLAVNTMIVPPLRQRPEDIVDLITFFVRKFRRRYEKQVNYLPQTVIDLLVNHPWPGNVAELKELVRRAVLLAGGSAITEQEIIFDRHPAPAEAPRPEQTPLGNFFNQPLKELLDDFENNLASFIKQ
jgi:transcriptional regulator with GAF, ATPase, and Fis domain